VGPRIDKDDLEERKICCPCAESNCDPSDVQFVDIQGDQKVSVHLMITIYKVTSNVQSVPRQSPDIY
jgi:hypothetical protein